MRVVGSRLAHKIESNRATDKLSGERIPCPHHSPGISSSTSPCPTRTASRSPSRGFSEGPSSFFFSKADTPGCTVEACGFRDQFAQLEAAGAVVVGISRDTPKAQKRFKGKFHLPYTLLADSEQEIIKRFNLLKQKSMYGKPVTGVDRTTYVLGSDGRLLHVFANVKPQGHAEEVLPLLRKSERIPEPA